MHRDPDEQISAAGICTAVGGLLEQAMRFVPLGRGEALLRKWANPRAAGGKSNDDFHNMAADAAVLGEDFLLSQPSSSGATAFDRLARSRHAVSGADAAAMAALRQARFRVLRLEGDGSARDLLSGESLRIEGLDLPAESGGLALFARVAMLGEGLCCMAGAVTPLDAPALMVACDHACAGARGAAAAARWAEAVYIHVVRHGTLNVPGLNRPQEEFFGEDDLFTKDAIFAGAGCLVSLGQEWEALQGGAPNAALLEHTRQHANLNFMVHGFAGAFIARGCGQEELAAALERMLLAQMETVQRREAAGSGTLTLDLVGKAVPPGAQALFAALRQRLGGPARKAADPGLERLLGRIQALRAKTVAQGCTEQEALAAAEKVAELLDRHGLSLSELDFRAQPCEGIGVQTTRRRLAPIDSCVPGIATFFGCRVWIEQKPGEALRHIFFGLRGDVAAAQYLYEMVERAFETETGAFRAGALYTEMAGERRSASNSFQIGLAQGIINKLGALRAARDGVQRSASGRDLVPVKAVMVDEEMAKLGLDLRAKSTSAARRVLTDAFEAGQEAGQRFEVVQGIARAA